jgi:hypothetical protein
LLFCNLFPTEEAWINISLLCNLFPTREEWIKFFVCCNVFPTRKTWIKNNYFENQEQQREVFRSSKHVEWNHCTQWSNCVHCIESSWTSWLTEDLQIPHFSSSSKHTNQFNANFASLLFGDRLQDNMNFVVIFLFRKKITRQTNFE